MGLRSGALGHGDFIDHKTPHEIAFLGECRVIMISVGGEHTLFLCEDSQKKKKKVFSRRRSFSNSALPPRVLFCMWSQRGGATGLGVNGTTDPECVPKQVLIPKQVHVTSIHCGWDFTAIRGTLDDEALRSKSDHISKNSR